MSTNENNAWSCATLLKGYFVTLKLVLRSLSSYSALFSQLGMDPLTLTVSITALISTTAQVVIYLNDIKDAPKERKKLASETDSLVPLLIQLKHCVEEMKAGEEKCYESTRTILGEPNGPLHQVGDAFGRACYKVDAGYFSKGSLAKSSSGRLIRSARTF
jgi:hypothetical protein